MPRKVLQHPEFDEAWKNRVAGIRSEKSYRDYDAINGESTEFEWNIFPGFTTPQPRNKINGLLGDLGQTPETFTGSILFMSMFNGISCDRKGNKDECLANAGVVKVFARIFGVGQWSFLGPGSEKKWYSMEEKSPQGIWDHIADKMLLEFAEAGVQFSVQQLHCPGVYSRAKGEENCQNTSLQTIPSIETIFPIIISVNQLSLYGAVANMCEEFESLQDRSGQLDVLMGQSIVLSEIKAEVPLENNIPSHQNLLLQRYAERIEMLSPESKVSKFCMDAGFIHVVETDSIS